MDYTINKDETCRGFMYRALQGKTEDDNINLITFLLEMIVSEIKENAYSIFLNVNSEEVTITVEHHGKAIKNNILDIINDQMDYLHYQHQTKDSHKLKIQYRIKDTNA